MAELVSIIMPSYNTASFIAESIQSVQAQSYENWELLIVDDCSTDHTDEVVKPYLADKRINYLKNKKNSGAAASRNRALREAKGKWIAFLDSDDLWMPNKLSKQVKFMEEHCYQFSYTNYSEIDSQNRRSGVTVTGPNRITKHGMFNYCWPGCLTVMYDSEAVGLLQIADIQKNKAKKVNPKRFVDTGLYKFVRCPNYLGEMIFWTGVLISGIGAITGATITSRAVTDAVNAAIQAAGGADNG